jgi:glycogen debranching enzyme
MLAGAYLERTGDLEFIRRIWHGLECAARWLDSDGDPDGDGFVEYQRKADGGLIHQGWKDSADAVFHRDGTPAEPPIALCEVQAYTYAAKRALAGIARALGREEQAARLAQEAALLQERFEHAFWSPELGTYVLALDGRKRACQVRASNPGHALYCGISSQDKARAVAHGFFDERFYSGWGIRTVAMEEPCYNPMSYHNGSVWPHDNAVIAAGLSRYGLTHFSARVLAGLFQAAATLDLSRLPELFCGFRRRPGKSPTLYPTACAPQAWSAGAAFLLLQSSLGLSVDALERRVILRYPVLPDFLNAVHIQNLTVGDARLDLRLFRSGEGVSATVEQRTGQAEVLVLH